MPVRWPRSDASPGLGLNRATGFGRDSCCQYSTCPRAPSDRAGRGCGRRTRRHAGSAYRQDRVRQRLGLLRVSSAGGHNPGRFPGKVFVSYPGGPRPQDVPPAMGNRPESRAVFRRDAPGALFSAGDGHGVQGDGEVCINALEICLTGTFTLTLHKGNGARAPMLSYPRAETASHFISMGMHEDLDIAMKTALREMIAFITSRPNLSRQEAYQFCSLAVDFHVTQTVNGEKGVHGLLKKGLLF